MEVPLSSNGLLSLSSLQTLFPRCSGIGKRNIRSGFVRLSRLEGGFLHPIDAATWGQDHYVCLFPKRPHSEDDDSEGQDSPYTDSEDEDESEGEKEVKPLKISDIVRRFTNLKAENVTQAPKRRRANDGSSVVVQKSNLKCKCFPFRI